MVKIASSFSRRLRFEGRVLLLIAYLGIKHCCSIVGEAVVFLRSMKTWNAAVERSGAGL